VEAGKRMTFDGCSYLVVSRYLRTRGGQRQRLTTEEDGKTQKGRAFYLVEDDSGARFWVKEYTDMSFGTGGIQREYDRMVGCDGVVVTSDDGWVRAVKPLCLSANRILMEYCGVGFRSFAEARAALSPCTRKAIRWLVSTWLAHPETVPNYDLSSNNVMVSSLSGGGVGVVLVDLEVSELKRSVSSVLA